MSVRIEAAEGSKLKLSGDIAAMIDLPMRAVREGFTLAFSDGTLVRGDYDFAAGDCAFEIVVEGAAVSKVTRENARETLEIHWPIEWITVAAGDDTICANEQNIDADRQQLALQIDQLCAA